MKATIHPRQSDRIAANRKEDKLHREYVAICPKTGRAIVTLRIYWPGSVAYACVWIHAEPIHARGAGRAGGGGYCKESAAAGAALRDAGVTLSEPIDGCGLRAIESAVLATAQAATGRRKFFIHVAHG